MDYSSVEKFEELQANIVNQLMLSHGVETSNAAAAEPTDKIETERNETTCDDITSKDNDDSQLTVTNNTSSNEVVRITEERYCKCAKTNVGYRISCKKG